MIATGAGGRFADGFAHPAIIASTVTPYIMIFRRKLTPL
jgi:hypothetical protein